jgi:hypothetical protein
VEGDRVDTEAGVSGHYSLEIGFYCEIEDWNGAGYLPGINLLFVSRVFGLRRCRRIRIHKCRTDRRGVLRPEREVYLPSVRIRRVHLSLGTNVIGGTRLIIDLDQEIEIV